MSFPDHGYTCVLLGSNMERGPRVADGCHPDPSISINKTAEISLNFICSIFFIIFLFVFNLKTQ